MKHLMTVFVIFLLTLSAIPALADQGRSGSGNSGSGKNPQTLMQSDNSGPGSANSGRQPVAALNPQGRDALKTLKDQQKTQRDAFKEALKERRELIKENRKHFRDDVKEVFDDDRHFTQEEWEAHVTEWSVHVIARIDDVLERLEQFKKILEEQEQPTDRVNHLIDVFKQHRSVFADLETNGGTVMSVEEMRRELQSLRDDIHDLRELHDEHKEDIHEHRNGRALERLEELARQMEERGKEIPPGLRHAIDRLNADVNMSPEELHALLAELKEDLKKYIQERRSLRQEQRPQAGGVLVPSDTDDAVE